jgi:hypothetical protein
MARGELERALQEVMAAISFHSLLRDEHGASISFGRKRRGRMCAID